MKRVALIGLLALSACADREVGQSVYFEGPYRSIDQQSPRLQAEVAAQQAQIAARQAELAAQQAASNRQEALVASIESAIDNAERRVEGGSSMQSLVPPLAPTETTVTAQLPVETPTVQPSAEAQNLQPVLNSDGTISDNSFSSVAARETIESDAARLARLQQGTVVLEAEPLPQRPAGPNLAAYALSTTHRVGQKIYRRVGAQAGSAARTCRRYRNPDEAQLAFLSRGGPDKDTLGIDPDGDGFVCGWTPDQLRKLRVGG